MQTEHSLETRVEFSHDDLEQYRGKWVAFSVNRTRIVASGDSDIEAARNATALGLTSREFVLEPIPQDDTLLL